MKYLKISAQHAVRTDQIAELKVTGREDNCGYDTGSRSAERTCKQVRKQTEKLSAFLGEKYHTYLWETAE